VSVEAWGAHDVYYHCISAGRTGCRSVYRVHTICYVSSSFNCMSMPISKRYSTNECVASLRINWPILEVLPAHAIHLYWMWYDVIWQMNIRRPGSILQANTRQLSMSNRLFCTSPLATREIAMCTMYRGMGQTSCILESHCCFFFLQWDMNNSRLTSPCRLFTSKMCYGHASGNLTSSS